MNDLAPHLRALLIAYLPEEEAERHLLDLSRELRCGVPVRRTVRYRLDETTGKTMAVRPKSRDRAQR